MPTPGLNYRLPTSSAPIGIPQVARLDELLSARERVAAWYDERLEHHVPHAVRGRGRPARLAGLRRPARASRRGPDRLRDAGIEAQIGTWALIDSSRTASRASFPGADRAFERALALPFATTTTEEEV
jgi:dTDP-4-amino-4,6-dideoxygalactose transaminase